MRTWVFRSVLILEMVVLLVVPLPGNARAKLNSSTFTLFQRIEQAYQRGEIDYETALLYKMYVLFSPEKVPLRLMQRPFRAIKCATPLFLELRRNWGKLSWEVQNRLRRYLWRSTKLTEYYPTEHFKIWYVTSEPDAPPLTDEDEDGFPDWIEECGQIFEKVRGMAIDSLGYREPPSDSLYCPSGQDYGRDAKYDVYVMNLRWTYGYTVPESYGPSPYQRCSYIVVDNDYAEDVFTTKGLDALRVTAAHEFFHAIQFAYDAGEDIYWMEICSTWMEDVVYDDVNDYYNYLPAFFAAPEESLDMVDGLREYASCIWAHFLAQNYGLDVIRKIWEKCMDYNSFTAFDRVLEDQGTNFYQAFKEFTVWNYYTGSRADPTQYYEEGAYYPEVEFYSIHSSYPDSGNGQIDHLGSSYIRFRTGRGPGGMKLAFNGADGSVWGVSIIANRGLWGYMEDDLSEFHIKPAGYGESEVRDWSRYSDVILIPAVLDTTGSYGFSYRAEHNSTLGELPPVAQTALLQNRPNPFRISDYPITCLPFRLSQEAEVEIRILTVAGELVRTINLGHLAPGYYDNNYQVDSNYWDGRNERGELVASGVYLYQLVAGDFVQTQKMVVIR